MEEKTVVTGHAFIGDDFEGRDVRIVVENGVITEIEETTRIDNIWICPCFFNAHTHLGDTIAMDVPATGTLHDLVAPPEGLKHRMLSAAAPSRLIAGMRASARYMLESGIAGFADFREGGAEGVRLLQSAIRDIPCHAIILGRNGGEMISDGIGISSIRDETDIENAVQEVRRLGKFVSFHAGEKDSSDIDGALAYEPDFLVHCTHASDHQLRMCAELDIPIVVCPRSNWALGVSRSPDHPPVRRMLELGCTVFLGTDNAMFVQPDMFQEMAYTALIYDIPPKVVLRMAVSGSRFFNRNFQIKEGNRANFMLIDPARGNFTFSHDPVATIVKRMNGGFIERNFLNLQSK